MSCNNLNHQIVQENRIIQIKEAINNDVQVFQLSLTTSGINSVSKNVLHIFKLPFCIEIRKSNINVIMKIFCFRLSLHKGTSIYDVRY